MGNMSPSTIISTFTDRDFSLSLLADSLIPTVIFMVSGLIAMITGTMSMLTVLKNKELRTTFYTVYAAIAVNDVIMGTAYVVTAVKRIYRQAAQVGEVMDRWHCCQESGVLYFSQTLGLYMAFVLAANRTYSTFKLAITKIADKNYCATYLLIIFAVLMSLFETVYMMFQGWHHNKILLSCGTASCWTASAYRLSLFYHLGVSFFVVLMNLMLIIIIHCLLKFKNNHLERRVTMVLTAMVVSHATSHIASRLGLIIIMHYKNDDPELTTVGLSLRNLVVINASLHFFIFYLTSSEFQKAVNKMSFTNQQTGHDSNQQKTGGKIRRLSEYKVDNI